MKKKLFLGICALVAAAALLWVFPHYALIGIISMLAGWFGRLVYAKRTAR